MCLPLIRHRINNLFIDNNKSHNTFIPVIDIVALSNDVEEIRWGLDDGTSWRFLELSSDDLTVVVPVTSNDCTVDDEMSSDDRSTVVKVPSNPLYRLYETE